MSVCSIDGSMFLTLRCNSYFSSYLADRGCSLSVKHCGALGCVVLSNYDKALTYQKETTKMAAKRCQLQSAGKNHKKKKTK